ncbi:site-specific DNA-methyltransferase, partial [Yersinia sp. 1252 StPb PI]
MVTQQNVKFRELVNKLREIFQIDRPELDFGIYRILNARSSEINNYLENRLALKVQAALRNGSEAQSELIARELKDKEAQYQADGIEPDTVPKVQELRQKLTQERTRARENEDAIFSHLLTFFSRYYDQGDFISQRRYKGETYAIPYAGEEVMLHWANKDQYYTKSGENFANYSFMLEDGRSVKFKLVTADIAKDNRKDNDKERRFILAAHKIITRIDEYGDEYEEELLPVEEVKGVDSCELIVRFEYSAQLKGTKQETLVLKAVETILNHSDVKLRWLDLSNRAPTEKNPQRTLLEKHLVDYTTKNTADYFIHKDLGNFLNRELDFYIKNEVMNLDDIQNAGTFSDIENSLRMIQCLRSIAGELIEFLAQLENFQKKLWLKKKFVVSSHYYITLDRIPEAMYPEIVSNESQWSQWKNLGVCDDNTPPTIDSLKSSLYRMVDTSLFSESFKARILHGIQNIDKSVDGILIHSDNFQALNLLQEKYKEK